MKNEGSEKGGAKPVEDNSPQNEYGGQFSFLGFGLLVLAVLAMLCVPTLANARKTRALVVYCAQDQDYAEPILKAFEKETGIPARAVYDSEAVKTVGLANRLLAERRHPVCDVFWGNEELRTRQLVTEGVFRGTNGWAAFGYRSRRIVFNTNQLSAAQAPQSLLQLTNAEYKGKVALAYPLFGTTSAHFQALRQRWGEAGWQSWCAALAANKPLLVDGNSVAAKMVGRGEALVGLTDSDDIASGQREGLPIAAVEISDETLLIPNTVCFVNEASHPEGAEKLFRYLQRPEVVAQLVAAKALEGDAAGEMARKTLRPDWPALLKDMDKATAEMGKVFLR
jgi:iron(III) transport system substrate-binding protein